MISYVASINPAKLGTNRRVRPGYLILHFFPRLLSGPWKPVASGTMTSAKQRSAYARAGWAGELGPASQASASYLCLHDGDGDSHCQNLVTLASVTSSPLRMLACGRSSCPRQSGQNHRNKSCPGLIFLHILHCPSFRSMTRSQGPEYHSALFSFLFRVSMSAVQRASPCLGWRDVPCRPISKLEEGRRDPCFWPVGGSN